MEVQAFSGRTDALLATVQAVLHVGRLVEPVMVTAVLADDAGGHAVTVRPAVSA